MPLSRALLALIGQRHFYLGKIVVEIQFRWDLIEKQCHWNSPAF